VFLPSFEKPVPLQGAHDQHKKTSKHYPTYLSMTTAGVWDAMLRQVGAERCGSDALLNTGYTMGIICKKLQS
jgi:hypothetical protein